MRDDAKPLLVFFWCERSGPARRMESQLAHLARKERTRLRSEDREHARPPSRRRSRVAANRSPLVSVGPVTPGCHCPGARAPSFGAGKEGQG